MTFDALLTKQAEYFLKTLSPQERHEFYDALDSLCADPYPDGRTKVHLDYMPYKPGVLGYSAGRFWMSYRILEGLCIEVSSVTWSPDSFNHPLG